jgi:hypothetical protein
MRGYYPTAKKKGTRLRADMHSTMAIGATETVARREIPAANKGGDATRGQRSPGSS